ncbi:SIR2 family protein [Alkalihalobacillus sp. 1P02AB]|uniref:SIR2 family protein n=1 Tax=Alkalihalobacillus sp. 1P02AB TaxID=3132260 RepID=UPI0039A63BF0
MKLVSYIEQAISENPLLVVGSGSSCGAGLPGMYQLSEFLQENLLGLVGEDAAVWGKISNLLKEGLDLESALQSVQVIPDFLTTSIVEETWACIAKDEKKAMMKIATGEDICGFVRYFKKYLHTKNKVLNVVTTNYDQIIEFSASIAGLQVWDGFNTGLVSHPISYNEFVSRMIELKIRGRNSSTTREEICHLKVFKPHGSLSWFKGKYGRFVSISNIGYSDLPLLRENGLHPVIVTPGIGKYLETHQQPYNNIIAEMNLSIQETRSVIFYGFGFNDIHIQGSFTSLLVDKTIYKIIIAKKLSDSFLEIVEQKKIINYLAIEELDSGSKLYSDIVKEENCEKCCWTFKGLLDMAWGELECLTRA